MIALKLIRKLLLLRENGPLPILTFVLLVAISIVSLFAAYKWPSSDAWKRLWGATYQHGLSLEVFVTLTLGFSSFVTAYLFRDAARDLIVEKLGAPPFRTPRRVGVSLWIVWILALIGYNTWLGPQMMAKQYELCAAIMEQKLRARESRSIPNIALMDKKYTDSGCPAIENGEKETDAYRSVRNFHAMFTRPFLLYMPNSLINLAFFLPWALLTLLLGAWYIAEWSGGMVQALLTSSGNKLQLDQFLRERERFFFEAVFRTGPFLWFSFWFVFVFWLVIFSGASLLYQQTAMDTFKTVLWLIAIVPLFVVLGVILRDQTYAYQISVRSLYEWPGGAPHEALQRAEERSPQSFLLRMSVSVPAIVWLLQVIILPLVKSIFHKCETIHDLTPHYTWGFLDALLRCTPKP